MPSYQVHYHRAKVVPGVPTSNIQFEYIRMSTPEYTNHTKKCKHILNCVVLCTLSPCNNTPAKRPSFARDMLDYITKKANLSRFRRYWGKFVFSIVYGVSVMRLMCAPDSFLWGEFYFYMRGIFPCSFAQIDQTTSSSSSRPNHAIRMMQIFRRYGGHWETVQSVAL